MKKIRIIHMLLIFLLITGCSLNSKDNNDLNKIETTGKCNALECINLISIDNTVEEINDIIGIKGTLTDEQYNIYYWELTEETGVSVTYYSGTKASIKVDIDKELLKNSKVDFSKYEELRTKINDGITYEEFMPYVGGVEGTLIEKGSITNKYIWVDDDGSYLNASFSTGSNKCTFVSGMIY